jgi:hypothetical protein
MTTTDPEHLLAWSEPLVSARRLFRLPDACETLNVQMHFRPSMATREASSWKAFSRWEHLRGTAAEALIQAVRATLTGPVRSGRDGHPDGDPAARRTCGLRP